MKKLCTCDTPPCAERREVFALLRECREYIELIVTREDDYPIHIIERIDALLGDNEGDE